MAEVASRRALTAGAPFRTQTWLMLDVWCTKYRKDRLLPEYFTFSVIIPQILDTHLSPTLYLHS